MPVPGSKGIGSSEQKQLDCLTPHAVTPPPHLVLDSLLPQQTQIGVPELGVSLVELQNVRLGFRPDHVLTFQLAPPPGRYPLDSKALVFYQQLVDTLRTIPTVEGAANLRGEAVRRHASEGPEDPRLCRHQVTEGVDIAVDQRIHGALHTPLPGCFAVGGATAALTRSPRSINSIEKRDHLLGADGGLGRCRRHF